MHPPDPAPRRSRSSAALLALALLGAAAAAIPAAAQAPPAGRVARADAFLRAGRVAAAESLYYTAARRRPRDPAARVALGRYLAARGALRVGAVLLEEARFFGGDSALVARELAPVYARLHDYTALVALPYSPLSGPERERAAWLRDHPPAIVGDDSVTVAFTPAPVGSPPGLLGSFEARVGGERALVAVDAGVSGWVLDPRWAGRRGVRLFGTGPAGVPVPGRTVGVADLRVGALSLVHQPVRLATAPAGAALPSVRVGLDALGALAPTFDARAGVLTLRGDGRLRAARRAERVAALLGPDGVYVPAGAALAPIASAGGRRVVPPGRRWSYDRRRGEVVVER